MRKLPLLISTILLFFALPLYAEDEEYEFPEISESKEGETVEEGPETKIQDEKPKQFQLKEPMSNENDNRTEIQKYFNHKKPSKAFIKSFEMIGLQLGVGGQIAGKQILPLAMPEVNILMFNLQYKHFFITFLEIHPLMFLSYFGLGPRFGGRFPLDKSFNNEFRLGAFIGLDTRTLFDYCDVFKKMATIRPQVQLIHNYDSGSVGLGIDLPISIIPGSTQCDSAHDFQGRNTEIAVALIVYVRLSFVRFSF